MSVDRANDPVVISFSGGGSSRWLYDAVRHGLVPRPAHLAVVFADTGEEHAWTYDEVEDLRETCARDGVPFLQASAARSLGDTLLAIKPERLSRVDNPPLWIAKDDGTAGRLRHECTAHFKVAPIRRVVSAWLAANGLPKRVTQWIGFGADEVERCGCCESSRLLAALDDEGGDQ